MPPALPEGPCVALIVAAGRGVRAGGGVPKQYRRIGGLPVLRRSLRPFLDHPRVDAVRVVIDPAERAAYDAAVAGLTLLDPVAGGETRQESVRRGLDSVADLAPATVLIHDGARPFVDAGVIDRVLGALVDWDGAVPAIAVADTVKRIDSGGRVVATVDRETLRRAQTPQGFRFGRLRAAHAAAAGGSPLSDDAAVAEAAGMPVAAVDGDPRNIKLTTPEDFAMADAMLRRSEETRTAFGFDVHRLGPGTAVRVGAVVIPHDGALIGHSDADVGLHALTDALLGTIAAEDIGHHFPPSDDRWKGADSGAFLRHAAGLVAAAGGRIGHVDLTIVCERPKIGPHRDRMRAAIAALLDLDPARVSVKATTSEGLGYTGRGEGIAAHAVATVHLARPEA